MDDIVASRASFPHTIRIPDVAICELHLGGQAVHHACLPHECYNGVARVHKGNAQSTTKVPRSARHQYPPHFSTRSNPLPPLKFLISPISALTCRTSTKMSPHNPNPTSRCRALWEFPMTTATGSEPGYCGRLSLILFR